MPTLYNYAYLRNNLLSPSPAASKGARKAQPCLHYIRVFAFGATEISFIFNTSLSHQGHSPAGPLTDLGWCPDAFPSTQFQNPSLSSRKLPVLSHELRITNYIPIPTSVVASRVFTSLLIPVPDSPPNPAYGHPEARSVLRRTLSTGNFLNSSFLDALLYVFLLRVLS